MVFPLTDVLNAIKAFLLSKTLGYMFVINCHFARIYKKF